jgi:hypothetical protein
MFVHVMQSNVLQYNAMQYNTLGTANSIKFILKHNTAATMSFLTRDRVTIQH